MKSLRCGVLFGVLSLMCFASQFTWATGVTRLEILPGSVKMKPGASIRFTVIAYTRDGSMFTPNKRIHWRTDRGRLHDGHYTAPKRPGYFHVWAQWRGLSAKVKIHVKRVVPPIKYLQIEPSEVKLQPQQKYQFRAIAYDHRRRPVQVDVHWSARGGRIDQNGQYYAPSRYGKYVVYAKEPHSGIHAQANVFVRKPAPQLSRLEIFPSKSVVRPGQKVRFEAKGYDRYGREVHVHPTWRASGGKIDGNGVYYAGSRPGKYHIWAVYGGHKAMAHVRIGGSYPDPQPSGRIEITYFKVGSSFFDPEIKVNCKVHGRNVQKIVLFVVRSNGRAMELETKYCKNGDQVKFREEYNRLGGFRWTDLWLYNSRGKIIAKERRSLK